MLLPHDRQAMHVCDWVLCKLQDGTPLRLNMYGFNLYTEGHFDLYIGDYYDYKVSSPSTSCSKPGQVYTGTYRDAQDRETWAAPGDAEAGVQEGAIDNKEFEVPEICPEKPEPGNGAGSFQTHVGGLARMRSLLPNAHYGVPRSQLASPPLAIAIRIRIICLSDGSLTPCLQLAGPCGCTEDNARSFALSSTLMCHLRAWQACHLGSTTAQGRRLVLCTYHINVHAWRL